MKVNVDLSKKNCSEDINDGKYSKKGDYMVHSTPLEIERGSCGQKISINNMYFSLQILL